MSVAEIVKPVVARQQRGSVLSAVEVEVGALAGVEIDTFRAAMDTVLKAEGFAEAIPEINEIPGTAICLDCERSFVTDKRNAGCPHCGSAKCLTTGGTELRVSGLRFKSFSDESAEHRP